MNSIDGTKDSAVKIKELMFNKIKKQLKKKQKEVQDESIY